MKHTYKRTLLLACVCWIATASQAETFYKSVDGNGNIVYSDHAPTQGRLEKTLQSVEQPASAEVTGASPSVTPPVVLYTATWCGYCKKAKAWLAEKAITYQEIDIDTGNGKDDLVQASGSGHVPFLVSGERQIRGYSPGAYAELFTNLQ